MVRSALSLLTLAFGLVAAQAQGPRVASLNLCVDQLVLALAEPQQIAGLSRYARDERLSHAAKAAHGFRLLAGAEEVLFLKPDLVLTSRFTPAATRDFLARTRVKAEEFEAATTLAQTRAQMLRMGKLLRQEARAQALVEQVDTAAERLKGAAPSGLRVLVLARRGYVSGASSLPGELLSLAGAQTSAPGVAGKRGGFATLESIVAVQPDALLITGAALKADDQGSALLEHPVLARLFPPSRRLHLPDHLTVCGGPGLIEAMDRLAVDLKTMPRR
ncbi:MAG: ABC transporter substrate-binding protein [Proteobacteria bacterium]|nr:ABC transporter substrate-binding protein [Pseudomonadota bacterium]